MFEVIGFMCSAVLGLTLANTCLLLDIKRRNLEIERGLDEEDL